MEIPGWVQALPPINAGLNSLATVLLIAGYRAIRQGRRGLHKKLMLSAFGVSIVFLGCYLAYHFGLQAATGDASKRFAGTGVIRTVYLVILATHIILAAAVPVLASMTIWRGMREDWARHRRIARITLPVWLYVSVTGVIIYLMVYPWPSAGASGPALSAISMCAARNQI